MKLGKMAELVVRLYEKARRPEDYKLDLREVVDLLIATASKLMKPYFYEARKEGDKGIPSHYLWTFENIPVIRIPDSIKCESIIPSKYLALPKDRGLYSVEPVSDDIEFNRPVILVRQGLMGITRNLPTGSMDLELVSEIRLTKLIHWPLRGKAWTEYGINKVNITLAIAGIDQNANIDDEFNIPPDIEMDVIWSVFMMFAQARSMTLSMKDQIDMQNELRSGKLITDTDR